MSKERKPLLCRLGWHTSRMLDCAMFTSALRCNRCGEWIDKAAGAVVDRERDRWESGRLSLDDNLGTALHQLYDGDEGERT